MTARTSVSRASLTAALVLGVDQLTKALATGAIERGEEREVLGSVLKLVSVRNDGVAFGFLGGGGALVVVLVAVSLLAVLVLFARNLDRPWAWLPAGLIVGGACGNLLDRARLGYVEDFLKLPSWPAFNAADVAITFGAVAFVLIVGARDAADRRT